MGIFTGSEFSLRLGRFIDGWRVSYSFENVFF